MIWQPEFTDKTLSRKPGAVQAGKLFWSLTDESNKEQADVIPVYAAAPASVVPDNASEPLAYAYKELTPEIMRNHLAVFERYGIAPNDSSTTIQALRIALDGIERSDAMLHGAEPVSQTYKLNQLSGNSPATPDGWISCSERMPNTKTAVLVAVEFDRKGDWRMKWATYIPGHPDANDGWIIPGASWKPSHWMPLPEPPQEAK
ncbi:putative phage protein [Escherichia coli O145:H28]|nr:putative phage protein [Escherichia coli O145:H28]